MIRVQSPLLPEKGPMSDDLHIFVSVGSTATPEQEQFVCVVEARLRAENLLPHTVGRNTFSVDAPLKTVADVMSKCSGAVIIALERSYFPQGLDKPGPAQVELRDVRLATPWNQIEAAMAYSANLPLLVVLETGVKDEGLLERGNDWYVQRCTLSPASLSTIEFNGVFASWKQKVQERGARPVVGLDPAQLSIGTILSTMKPAQLWSALAALGGLLAATFTLGAHLVSRK